MLMDIALLVVLGVMVVLFCVMAYRIAAAISRESPVFREFGQPRTLAFLVMLFPFGPIMLYAGKFFLPVPLVLVAAAACYLPAVISARSVGGALERAGTDRVRRARDIVSQAIGTAIVGLIFVGLSLALVVAVSFIE